MTKRMNIEEVAKAVEIAIRKLPYMENLYQQAKDEAEKMQCTRQQSENYLYTVEEEIASSKELLKSYTNCRERKKQEAENLNKEILRLEAIVSRFRSDNEEYIKIKKTVEEDVSSVLTDGKVLIQFALASIIEALRRNPDKYNDLLANDTSSTITSASQSPPLLIEDYKDMILDEANRLYDRLLKHLINNIMDNGVSASSLSNSSSSSSSTFQP